MKNVCFYVPLSFLTKSICDLGSKFYWQYWRFRQNFMNSILKHLPKLYPEFSLTWCCFSACGENKIYSRRCNEYLRALNSNLIKTQLAGIDKFNLFSSGISFLFSQNWSIITSYLFVTKSDGFEWGIRKYLLGIFVIPKFYYWKFLMESSKQSIFRAKHLCRSRWVIT